MSGGMIPHPFIAEHDGPEAYIPTAMPRSLDILEQTARLLGEQPTGEDERP